MKITFIDFWSNKQEWGKIKNVGMGIKNVGMGIKELGSCRKLKLWDPYLFATWWYFAINRKVYDIRLAKMQGFKKNQCF